MTASDKTNADPRFRVRISLVDSVPEIWRLIELDSALTLDAVHDVIQRAVGWRNEHLHMFAKEDPRERLGPGNRDLGRVELRWYDQESLDEGLPGQPETECPLHQVLSEESPAAYYEYDFGDGWWHRLELVGTVESDGTPRAARLLDGAQRAPLEDSGGIHGYLDKLDVLADPQHDEHEFIREWVEDIAGPWRPFDPEDLDIDHVNSELAIAHQGVGSGGELPLWRALAAQMLGSRASEFRHYVSELDLDQPAAVDDETAARMSEPYAWLLRRIGTEGLTLTGAGWMPPDVVSDAMRDLDWGWRWLGEFNRESQTLPILNLRANAQRFGFVHKRKGRLLLTSAGKRLLDDPTGLWRAIARGVAHRQRDEAISDASALFAVEIARGTVDESRQHRERISYGLGMLGWGSSTGWVSADDVGLLINETRNVCEELGVFTHGNRRHDVTGVTPGGMAFARAVLQS